MMFKRFTNHSSGYTAIATVMLLSFTLLVIATSFSITMFLRQSGAGRDMFRHSSYALAWSCVDRALLKTAQLHSYTGGEAITIDTDQVCEIESVVLNIGSKIAVYTITTVALVDSVKTRLVVTTDDEFEITSVVEQ